VPISKRIISNFLSLNFVLFTISSILLNLSFIRIKFENLDFISFANIFEIDAQVIKNRPLF